jgi:hypothetical protein
MYSYFRWRPIRCAQTQARPDWDSPSGPRETDAGWMGAHAPITTYAQSYEVLVSFECPFTLTIPLVQCGRTVLGRGTPRTGSTARDNLVRAPKEFYNSLEKLKNSAQRSAVLLASAGQRPFCPRPASRDGKGGEGARSVGTGFGQDHAE